jgi:hypothetical protein
MDGAEHRVMITGSAAVVLVQDYQKNQGLELQVVCDVHDKLLSKIWEVRQTSRGDSDDPGTP